ncbi:MAG: hypothetical protein ACJAYO_002522, partial [Thalassolituus oleivorans]
THNFSVVIRRFLSMADRIVTVIDLIFRQAL